MHVCMCSTFMQGLLSTRLVHVVSLWPWTHHCCLLQSMLCIRVAWQVGHWWCWQGRRPTCILLVSNKWSPLPSHAGKELLQNKSTISPSAAVARCPVAQLLGHQIRAVLLSR